MTEIVFLIVSRMEIQQMLINIWKKFKSLC